MVHEDFFAERNLVLLHIAVLRGLPLQVVLPGSQGLALPGDLPEELRQALTGQNPVVIDIRGTWLTLT